MKAFEYVTPMNSDMDIEVFEEKELEVLRLQEVMEVCRTCCCYFSLTEQTTFSYTGMKYEEFRKELSPYLFTSFLTTEWFSYFTSDMNQLKVSVYYLNEQTEKILLGMFQDVFMNDIFMNGSIYMPEDICFFRKDKSLFFGSVSHESIAFFYLRGEELGTCRIPETFEEIPEETITVFNGQSFSSWSNYNVTF